MATSRQRLAISAEVTYALPPLALPPNAATRLGADEAHTYDAVALFVERARQAQPDGLYSDATAPIVADICRRLDGIALAIELAAARVRTLRLAEIRRHLDERFMLLVGGMRDALPHHRTLRATFDWSYDLLDERERAFLCASAIFVNGFTLEAARAVCTNGGAGELDALEVLTSLGRQVARPGRNAAATKPATGCSKRRARTRSSAWPNGARRKARPCGSCATSATSRRRGAARRSPATTPCS